MAKQSKSQKKTLERVMHEFKHGELETGTGKKVRSRKQAIAIGLSEAGASDQQSGEQNRKSATKTRQKERKGETARQRKERSGPTKAELMEQARTKDVKGRSKMTKKDLINALNKNGSYEN